MSVKCLHKSQSWSVSILRPIHLTILKSTKHLFSARALERFLEYIMLSSAEITNSKDAKTLTSQHILEVITNDTRLSFLKDAALKSCQIANGNQSNDAGSSFSNKKEPKSTNRENTKQSEEVNYL